MMKNLLKQTYSIVWFIVKYPLYYYGFRIGLYLFIYIIIMGLIYLVKGPITLGDAISFESVSGYTTIESETIDLHGKLYGLNHNDRLIVGAYFSEWELFGTKANDWDTMDDFKDYTTKDGYFIIDKVLGTVESGLSHQAFIEKLKTYSIERYTLRSASPVFYKPTL